MKELQGCHMEEQKTIVFLHSRRFVPPEIIHIAEDWYRKSGEL